MARRDYVTAINHQNESLAICKEFGYRLLEAKGSKNLGDALLADGRPTEAQSAWREGWETATQLQIPEAAQLRQRLDQFGPPSAPARAR
jgi:hypothetical protein